MPVDVYKIIIANASALTTAISSLTIQLCIICRLFWLTLAMCRRVSSTSSSVAVPNSLFDMAQDYHTPQFDPRRQQSTAWSTFIILDKQYVSHICPDIFST